MAINSMQAGAPGQLTRGTRMSNINTFAVSGTGTPQQIVWAIAETEDVAAGDTISFSITVNCVTANNEAPFTAVFSYTDETGAELIEAIAAALALNPNINALGTFSNDGGSLKFVSGHPGVNITVAATFTPGAFTVVQSSNTAAVGFNQVRFKPGTAAHYVPGEPLGVSGRRALVVPTQNPATGGTTQEFAGIVLDCDVHEMAPANPAYPSFSNNCSDPEPQTCYSVLNGSGSPVVIALETPYDATQPLHYRITPNAPFTELGMFRFGAATGCIPVPFRYEIISFDFGSLAAEIEIK